MHLCYHVIGGIGPKHFSYQQSNKSSITVYAFLTPAITMGVAKKTKKFAQVGNYPVFSSLMTDPRR